MKYRLEFDEQLLLCLIYYRTYVSHVFLGLMFSISSPTVCRRIGAMTQLLAGHFRLPERRVKLSAAERECLLYLMIDCTERPVQRPKSPGKRKKTYSGKKKRHTASHQIITDNNKRILAVGPAQQGQNMINEFVRKAIWKSRLTCWCWPTSAILERPLKRR